MQTTWRGFDCIHEGIRVAKQLIGSLKANHVFEKPRKGLDDRPCWVQLTYNETSILLCTKQFSCLKKILELREFRENIKNTEPALVEF